MYAITGPNITFQTQLPKFVQINWCGDGVPSARKGLFYSHSNSVSNYLRNAHVVVNARNEVRSLVFLLLAATLNF